MGSMLLKWAICLLSLVLIGCAKRYAVEGLVIRVDPAQRSMLVSHRAIRGLHDVSSV